MEVFLAGTAAWDSKTGRILRGMFAQGGIP